MENLIAEASREYISNRSAIFNLSHRIPLMDGSALCNALKAIAKQYAFAHRAVLKTEMIGATAIYSLMGEFWEAISKRKITEDLLSRRTEPRAAFVYSLISPNYLEAACDTKGTRVGRSIRYRELRLLTDMLSGMTDTFALKTFRDLTEMPNGRGI
jgi:dGTPase